MWVSGFVHWTILPCALDVGWIAFATCTTPSIEDHVSISIPILKTSHISSASCVPFSLEGGIEIAFSMHEMAFFSSVSSSALVVYPHLL